MNYQIECLKPGGKWTTLGENGYETEEETYQLLRVLKELSAYREYQWRIARSPLP